MLSVGQSKLSTDPALCEFFVHSPRPKVSIHSEVDAIRRCQNTNKATLYVARIGRNNKIAMSRPCKACQIAIKDAGIRRVVYTVDGSTYSTWTP